MKKNLYWVGVFVAFIIVSAVGKTISKAIVKTFFTKSSSISNPFPKNSALFDPYRNYRERLLSLPEFKQYLIGAKNEEEAATLSMILMKIGMRKLDDAALEKRMKLFLKILEKSDLEVCARIVRGSSEPTQGFQYQLFNGLEKLDALTINDFFDLAFNATIAGLRNYPESPLSDQQISKSMDRLAKRLPVKDSKKLDAVLDDLTNSNDQDACWAGRTTYREALKMNDTDRKVLARAFVLE